MSMRLHTCRLFVLAMLTGGLFLAPGIAAQGVSPFGEATPVADEATPSPSTSGAWEVIETRAFPVDGNLVTLSPDGRWIAGIGPDHEFCVWAVDSGEPTCAEPGDYRPHAESFRWAPDSSAVAFAEDALRTFVDSDLYVFELDAGQLVNLTDDGFSGGMSIMGEQSATAPLLDMAPAWLADGESLVFSRMQGIDRDGPKPEILQIERGGGEPVLLATLDVETSAALAAPIVALDDGRLVFSIDAGRLDDPTNGIWILDPGQAPRLLMPGGEGASFPLPRMVDARVVAGDLVVTGFSRVLAAQAPTGEPATFVLHADTGEVVALAPGMASLRFGPDGESTIAMDLSDEEGMLVITSPSGATSVLGPVGFSRFAIERGFDWSSANTVLVVGLNGQGVLIQLAPVVGT